jgi:hypothetical protein
MSAVGRDREFAPVPTFLDGIEGRSGVLQFGGPAGIGKTTLWEEAVAAARARAIESSSRGPRKSRRRWHSPP